MQNNYLVPSLLKNKTFNKHNHVMLGHWCAAYQPEKKKLVNYKILDHPWGNQKRFEKDYIKIQIIYEKILKKVQLILNDHFGINNSIKFWRILIGPWINAFITMYFEKIILLKKIKKKKKINVYKYKKKFFIADNPGHFMFMSSTDEWQYYFFLELIKEANIKSKFLLRKRNSFIKKPIVILQTKKKTVFLHLNKIFNFLFGFLKKKQKVVLFNTYLGKYRSIFFYLRNFQFLPAFNLVKLPRIEPNFDLREKLASKFSKKKSLESHLIKQILMNLPISYFENFEKIEKSIKKLNLPKAPIVIFTSNGLYIDPIESRYIAESVERGSKLILGQHGGNYVNFKQNFFTEHEIKVSDYFLTWGWKKNSKKIKKFGRLLNINHVLREKEKICKNDRNTLLLVTIGVGKYTKNLQSFNKLAKQLYDYYYKFFPNFISAVSDKIRKNLVLRTYKDSQLHSETERGWNLQAFLISKFKNIQISEKQTDYYPMIKKSKLTVCTYFATVFFESMSANIPTILILPYSYNIFNNETDRIMKRLKKANIFFTDYKSAAKFINSNWNNIDSWWNNKKTQTEKNNFTKNYSKENSGLIADIQKLIDNIKNEKSS